ncbi:TBC1 domain family member 1 isoform X4 [Plutella xylostella]|uniref:TBC1 domain family member 1 isoform X4 n=1 Tax=Plutella xylostella TaxID=51655 RepID=UPI002032B938|nr:TBC1 domain family member 1 isoform X4 [Plutella xylostella]
MTLVGRAAMDWRFFSMLPTLLREIRRNTSREKLGIAVEDGYLKAYNGNFEPVLVHRLVDIMRASQVPGSPEELFYIMYNEAEGLLNCFLFSADSDTQVSELFTQMREPSPGASSPRGSTGSLQGSVMRNLGFQSTCSTEHLPWAGGNGAQMQLSGDTPPPPPLLRSTSNASALTSLCADLSPSDSHFFEVLYIGKVRISQRKVPDTLIDDALVKFVHHEAEKVKANMLRRHSLLSSTGTSIYSSESAENLNEDKTKTDASIPVDKHKIALTNTSTTPLEPDKNLAWRSVDNVNVKNTTKSESNSPNSDLDQEFDMFTKARVESKTTKNGQVQKRPTPLEPTVLVLNVPNKNLGTVDEEKTEDIHTMISDAASNITQFCQTNILKHNSEAADKNDSSPVIINIKDTNPFLPDVVDGTHNDAKDSSDDDILLKTPLKIIEDPVEPKTQAQIVESKEKIREDSPAPLNFDEISRKPKMLMRSKTGLENADMARNTMPENKPFLRDRSASIGTLNLKTPIAHLIGEQNRTMLFQVGRSELRLISPDRKQILLHRGFKDVASCVLGRTNKEHFGFVCRENSNDAYACYVFKCESDEVALEVVNAIKQAFNSHAELMKKTREKSPSLTCEHCPMLWFHRLCIDIEGLNEKKTHAFILRRIEQLPDDEQEQVIVKYQGGTNHMYETSEHNTFLMMLLRAHCEAKQLRHVHDTAENRTEFLNQYLGGSTIFMKAKRSLSSGFDQLLKRKSSRDEGSGLVLPVKKETSPLPTPPIDSTTDHTVPPLLLTPDVVRAKSMSPGLGSFEPPPSPSALSGTALPIAEEEEEDDDEEEGKPENGSTNSPMMDLFLKVSDNRPSVAGGEGGAAQEATWRQAIYQKVINPADGQGEDVSATTLLNLQPARPAGAGRRSREQLRQLWRLAIDQTVLLVRMEKENRKLRESEESSAVRRIKLEYTELGVCDAGVMLMWDSLLASRDSSNQVSKVDHHMLTQAVIQGVPRMCRGGVWYFLAEQAALRSPPPDAKKYPNYQTPYRTLLSGLTKHQHAILIDLGRTFPQHSYFASALGPGQLSLYNILKAYSLLDPEVGYCQGLSFVAGVLLLHMEEQEAFILLRHLMFRRGLRKQYLPDMSALQVQLYQLSRLLRDHEPELQQKLESLDISPALYAAPWMLTLFTSQFPLGFVVRVFDLILLESTEVVFAVSLALLSIHKDGLMMCESCEEAAEYLKHKLPDINKTVYEKVMRKVHALDISRQLSEYAVEYSVLREEMPRVAILNEQNKKLLADNRRMEDELDSAMDAINNYQASQAKLESQVKVLDHQLTFLSRYISAHHRTDLPVEIKKIVQNHSKKISFSSKLFNSKFAKEGEEEETTDQKKTFKTGMSTPNLFSKISKDDVMNAANKEKNKVSPDNDRRHFMMKKSMSVHSGLIATNLKQYPLKTLEEKSENEIQRSESFRNSNIITESLKELSKKNTGFFANTHDLVKQERNFEQQLKRDFDENLKKLDAKLTPTSYLDDISIFQSRKSMSLNLTKANSPVEREKHGDSGFVTPMSPDDKKEESGSIISHPLSDCDVDIKFDGQLTKLKQIRPLSKSSRNSIDSGDSKLM